MTVVVVGAVAGLWLWALWPAVVELVRLELRAPGRHAGGREGGRR